MQRSKHEERLTPKKKQLTPSRSIPKKYQANDTGKQQSAEKMVFFQKKMHILLESKIKAVSLHR